MKKGISIILILLILISCLGACGNGSSKNNDKLKIVTTIFPEYDWTKTILGERGDDVELILLLGNGVDLHNYQPTAEDILNISTCDLLVYVGGESDKWIEDALKEVVNKDQVVINLLEVLGDKAKEEEVIEGMQEEEKEHEGHEEEGPEYDEHVWLSLRNAEIFIESITNTLCDMDADNADTYKANAADYIGKLKSLDNDYADAVKNARVKTLLFGDRFPFRYFVDDYGLSYYAAFAGCSAETEASFETVLFLASKLDELGLNAVLKIEGKDQRIAETIISNTRSKNQSVLTMDSMQGTTIEDVNNGVTYLSIMESNLEVLKEALR